MSLLLCNKSITNHSLETRNMKWRLMKYNRRLANSVFSLLKLRDSSLIKSSPFRQIVKQHSKPLIKLCYSQNKIEKNLMICNSKSRILNFTLAPLKKRMAFLGRRLRRLSSTKIKTNMGNSCQG